MSKRKRKNSIEVLENMREKDKEKVNDMKIKEMILLAKRGGNHDEEKKQ